MPQSHDHSDAQERIPVAPQDDTQPSETITTAETTATTTTIPTTAHPEPLSSPTFHHTAVTQADHTQPHIHTISQETEPTTSNALSTTIATTSIPHTTTPPPPPEVLCAQCDQPMQGSFVRALGATYHLECFKCLVMLPTLQ